MEQEELFENGQWVQIVGAFRIINGYVGFVETYNPKHNMYHVRFVRNKKGDLFAEKAGWVEQENLAPLDSRIHIDDFNELINMALDMGDEKWFEELSNMLKPQAMPW